MSNMVVQTNVLALNSHRNMKTTGASQKQASARLSSGFKINSAADDAAGLAISEKMRSQIRGLDMASKNAQDGQALIQTAEGGLQEIDNMIQRIRELLVQASNDSNEQSDTNRIQGDRHKIQDEIAQLVSEIDSMAERVEFNKKKVINGDYADNEIMNRMATANASTAAVRLAAANDEFTSAQTDYQASTNDMSISEFNARKDRYLTASNAQVALGLFVDNMDDVESNVAELASGSTLFFQLGANANQGVNTSISRIKSDVLGIGNGHGVSDIDILESTGAAVVTGYLNTLDVALTIVTAERAKLGAVQNRLDYTMRSLDISSENLTDSESRIRDADMAKEMMNFTKTNVLQQAAISMLAQANQLPQNLLQLLR